ncbi:MAG TPA: hypothetical protein DCQ98_15150 [Planctomycetaceae bacterium]|nr:hypothetical protein [Planctomycetaceae bacterium]HRF01364.1 GyrI-like domain-containing protein [Pirellulaceae bacterium]
MKVMVIVHATASSEAGEMPSAEMFEAMGRYNEQLIEAGIMVEGAGLKPSSAGARVRFAGTERLVTQGPFAETRELIAGYWLWQVDSLEQAIEWVKRCPNPMPEELEIEIRPLFAAEDFVSLMTPEQIEHEATLLAKTLQLAPPRFERIDELRLVGLSQRHPIDDPLGIPGQWESFLPLVGRLGIGDPQVYYGACVACDGSTAFEYVAAVESDRESPLPAELTRVEVPARRYAIFDHHDHVSKLQETFERIWKRWLPESGFRAADAPVLERYGREFDPRTGMGGMEVLIPLAD